MSKVTLSQGSNPGPPDRQEQDNIHVELETQQLHQVELFQEINLLVTPGAGQHLVEFDMDYWEHTDYAPVSEFEILFQYDPESVCGDRTLEGEDLKVENNGDSCLQGNEAANAQDINNARVVRATGKFNFQEARVPVKTKWNLELFEQLLTGYHDAQVVEFARYGWPVDRDDRVPLPKGTTRNHKGATDYPEAVNEHITRELELGALAGPFDDVPLENFVSSPINSRPKRNSDKKRIIMDLSWEPGGPSVNAGISKDRYLGEEVRLRYPTVRTLIKRIKELVHRGEEQILMYKRDWARAFSQLMLDPGCYHYIGFYWQGKYYFSKVVPMGLVSACLACQRTTSAVRYIMNNMGYYLCNYIDDMVSAEWSSVAWDSFQALGRLFRDLRIDESHEKAVEPTTCMEFVGNLLNTSNFTISVTEERRVELRAELQIWMERLTATRRQLESLVGKLQFVCNCVRSGRLFLNRLLNFLRGMRVGITYKVPLEALRDIRWWNHTLEIFEGTSLMWLESFEEPDVVVAADACMEAAGGTYSPGGSGEVREFYRCQFPEHIRRNAAIAFLELWALILMLKIWGPVLRGKKVVAHCDNEAVANLVNSGRAREKNMQDGLREVCFLAAQWDFEIICRYLPGVQNRIPDLLSRWNKGEQHRRQFRQLVKGANRKAVRNSLFYYSHDW